jgi:hypothetical protein
MEQPQSDFLTHESGTKYKNYTIGDEQIRLFVSEEVKRLEFETYEEYKWRRSIMKDIDKQRKKGVMFWPSRLPIGNGQVVPNTYNKERAETIKQNIINKQKEENGKED